MPLAGWKTTVDRADVEDVLRILVTVSEGRFCETEIAEVLDALAHTEADCARAFRFGKPRSFAQMWIGIVPSHTRTVKMFVLGSLAFVEGVEGGVSVAKFAPAEKRAEYELLRRFFLTAWEWQWMAAPFSAELRKAQPKGFDPARTAESMDRVLSNPRSPLPELLRGLRRRALALVDDTADLSPADLEAADAYLATRGAATLSEMRRRYRDSLCPTDPP